MSQVPPPYDPIQYAYPGVPMPRIRPTSVTVIAIIGIIFGGFGVFGGICGAPNAFGMNLTGAPNPMLDAMKQDTTLMAFSEINHVIGAILSVMEVVAAIYLLMLKPWARRLMINFAVLDIVVIIGSVAANLLFVRAHMAKVMATGLSGMSRMPGMNPASAQMIGSLMKIGMAIGPYLTLLVLIWPGLVWYFMTRPATKAAFEGGPPPGSPAI